MNIYSYGHDFGNSDTGAVISSPVGAYTFDRVIPSVSAPGSWKKVMESASGMGLQVKDTLQSNHYILEYDREIDGATHHIEKVIGQKVFDDGSLPMETRGDDARYWSNSYSLELLMVGSASMVAEEEYGLHVVTGLPVSAYSQESAALVRSALQGTHLFWLNGVQRIMHIESVKVIMEGAGALIAHGSGDVTCLQGVVDIGGHTTDLFLSKGQKPLTSLCKGKTLGVSAAAERFNVKFRDECHRDLSLATRMELLRQYVAHRPYRPVQNRNGDTVNPIYLGRMIEESLREIGDDIATFAASTWNDQMYDLDQVLLVGGGAYYFAKSLQSRFKRAQAVSKPELANARGYASLAKVLSSRSQLHIAS